MQLEGTGWFQQRAALAREFERWLRVGRGPSETVPAIAPRTLPSPETSRHRVLGNIAAWGQRRE
jgi:hypothetical protein